MMLEQPDIHMQKNKSRHWPLILLTKVNSKCIAALGIKHKTVKFLEDNIGENLEALGVWQYFLKYNMEDMIHKKKIDKLTLLKLKISALLKALSREWEGKHRFRENVCKRQLIKDS